MSQATAGLPAAARGKVETAPIGPVESAQARAVRGTIAGNVFDGETSRRSDELKVRIS